jgi:hypothetical protein
LLRKETGSERKIHPVLDKWKKKSGQQLTAIWNSTKVSYSQQILGNPESAVDR